MLPRQSSRPGQHKAAVLLADGLSYWQAEAATNTYALADDQTSKHLCAWASPVVIGARRETIVPVTFGFKILDG